jgi:hypothetical protein
VVRHGGETEVFWNDPLFVNEKGRKLCNGGEAHKEKGKSWTELICEWSPRGSFLTTYHQQVLTRPRAPASRR